MHLGATQRQVDMKDVLQAGAAVRQADLRHVVGLPVLDPANHDVADQHGGFFDRHARHDPTTDQQIVAVVDIAGGDAGIDIDLDLRWR